MSLLVSYTDCVDPTGSCVSAPDPQEIQYVWERVNLFTTTGCWEWVGPKDPYGYGSIRRRASRRVPAHRWTYEWLVGPIPDGLQIDHLYMNRACVNPDHLEPVTQRENLMRGNGMSARHARATHCKRGHEKIPKNTYVRPDGSGTMCLPCCDIRAQMKELI